MYFVYSIFKLHEHQPYDWQIKKMKNIASFTFDLSTHITISEVYIKIIIILASNIKNSTVSEKSEFMCLSIVTMAHRFFFALTSLHEKNSFCSCACNQKKTAANIFANFKQAISNVRQNSISS